jgi:hypothetical protein
VRPPHNARPLSDNTTRDASANASPQVTVSLRGPVVYGRETPVIVRVGNPTAQPVIVLGVGASTGDGAFVSKSLDHRVRARAEANAATVSGVLMVEDIGPEARLPMPPRWAWDGDVELDCFPVLLPGEHLDISGRFRAGAGTGGRVEASARYIKLGEGAQLLHLREHALAAIASGPAGPGGSPARGWVATARATARYERAPGVAAPGSEAVPWDQQTDPFNPLPQAPPSLYRNALRRGELEALTALEARGGCAVAVEPPAITLSDARARAEISDGAAVYLPRLAAWVLQSGDGSAVVTRTDVDRVRGRLELLARRLVETEPVELLLYGGADTEDPARLVASLRSHGLDAGSERRKDGRWQGSVRVRAVEILRIANALEQEGHHLEGLRVVPD